LAFSRKGALTVKIIDLNAILMGFEQLLRRAIREDIDVALAPAATGERRRLVRQNSGGVKHPRPALRPRRCKILNIVTLSFDWADLSAAI
jgi:hypothetical protein